MELKDAAAFADQDSSDHTYYRSGQTDTKVPPTPPVATSPNAFLQHFGILATETANRVRQFVEFPFQENAEKQAVDTLAALEPFFWLLRALGLCARISIFHSTKETNTENAQKPCSIALLVYCAVIGLFLWFGFVVTFGFSLLWPVAFCAGMSSIMHSNQTYCKVDVMARFLTPKGMTTVIQSAFLFIGAWNMMVSVLACHRFGRLARMLRDYYAITKAEIVRSHKKIAVIHVVLAIGAALAVGVPFTIVYETMIEEIKSEQSYEGYPFADIDAPLIKFENWIAYTQQNATTSKNEKFILYGLKIVFRVQNAFMFTSCFSVPFFFSLACDVLSKEWKRFLTFLRLDSTKTGLSVERLRNIRNSHWMLCKIFYFLDGCFSKMILIIYVLFVLINSSVIYIVLKFGKIASGRDRFAFYQAIIMFTALQIIFFLVIVKAMRVHFLAKEVIVAVRDWQPNLDGGEMANEYILLVNQAESADVSFTAWNCFRIEDSAYINALAIIFSYVLMLLQFQPSDAK